MYLLYIENSKVMPKKRPPNKFDGLRVELKITYMFKMYAVNDHHLLFQHG